MKNNIKTCEEVIEKLKAFDYVVVDSSKEVVHTTIKGKGRVARLKKINKDTINLKDCAFPFRTPIENCFPALYGNISKRNGVLAANEYADKHQLNFTIIDFRISLEDAVDTTPKNKKEFFHSEVISLNRLSRNKIFQLYDDYIDDNSKKNLKNKTAYLDLIEKPD